MSSRLTSGLALAAAFIVPHAHAQGADPGWQACAGLTDGNARLQCFDTWATRQQAPGPAPAPQPAQAPAPAPTVAAAPAVLGEEEGCHDPSATELSRMWELEPRTSCGTFGLRGYRPLSLSLVWSNKVNQQPTSENPANNAPEPRPYRTFETKIQLSLRSKLGEGMLRKGDLSDSLWFAYTQQSYWQLFTEDLSRPFRNTDHEPEVFYIYPFDQALGDSGWRLRYGGFGLSHQSNGQDLPLSRSWNRVFIMGGVEKKDFTLQAKLWKRVPENAATDDNPDITDYIGRGELVAGWVTPKRNRWFFTWRTPFNHLDRGSARLQWMIPARSPFSGTRFGSLYFHTQVFTGYGDSLLDYNKARTVLSFGLSLYDW
ncbi:phospholipase A [Ramlibacter sp. G-1-2-2]|uniref:Phospholipase A1 n=1 Tax=Ramlibacter agri TaxID=2728837 RepID=A0A848GZY6_9BURK|nr:phospholipase A [Ramlibacter agri]NML44125.1 phospholipase A [Ramlibacter agri]